MHNEGQIFAEKVEGGKAVDRRVNDGGSKLPLSHQEEVIAELHETINQLAKRLEPVLIPGGAEGLGTAIDEPKDICSPLTDQMNANNKEIFRANIKLRDLIERIEC